jgi:hypothetical protein
MMLRIALGVLVALAVVAGPAGSTPAKLHPGQRCRVDRDAQYHRRGFHCINGRLVRATKAQTLGRAPATCAGAEPVPRSRPFAAYGTLFGTEPLWTGVYAAFDAARNAFVVPAVGYHRTRDGWPVKFLWITPRSEASPIDLKLTGAAGDPVLFWFGGVLDVHTRAPILDPANPGHPDTDDHADNHEWGSIVYFPKAGCYTLEAAWQGGSWRFVFGFGRR